MAPKGPEDRKITLDQVRDDVTWLLAAADYVASLTKTGYLKELHAARRIRRLVRFAKDPQALDLEGKGG